MAFRLPIELLDIVAQHAAMETQASLLTVSRGVYRASIRALYASIPHMPTSRTTQCLHTLSSKPEMARLVKYFSLRLSPSHLLRDILDILPRVLGNMTGLTSLSLQLGIFAKSSVLSQMSCRLTKFVCVLSSDDNYPISKFLSSQSAIEELYLVCRLDGLIDLPPEALPGLRDLAAPLHLLPKLLRSRISRLSRLSVLGTMLEVEDLIELSTAFETTKPPKEVELVLGVDITASLTAAGVLALGLSHIGLRAPFLSLLRLEIHRGNIRQNILEDAFKYSLSKFPNLKTLVIMSQPPLPGAYIRKSAQIRPALPLRSHSYMGNVPSDEFPTLSPRHLPPQSKHDKAQNWLDLIPDALYDRSCHTKILSAWHRVHPGLERVVFPIGAYTYVNKKRRSG